MKASLFLLVACLLLFSCKKDPVPIHTVPEVSTSVVTSISSSSVTAGGNVISDGGETVTARGICWSLNQNPDTSGDHTIDGTGTGIFTTTISGLAPGGTYYFRAYATNSIGTAYGEQVSLTNTVEVYAAGTSFVGSTVRATYWKNGVPVYLNDGTNPAYGASIYVHNSDVYVAGYETIGPKSIAKLWKNGVATTLSDNTDDAFARAVFVTDTDVYVAGNDTDANGLYWVPKYWKNGVPVTLSQDPVNTTAKAIAVSGTDVYVAGIAHGTYHRAKLWKNGVETDLPGNLPNTAAYSVVVNGTDVYIAGSETDNTTSLAKFWKNGASHYIPTPVDSPAEATSVFVSGTDIYVGGYEYIGGMPKPKIWKNDVPIFTGSTDGEIKALSVSGNNMYSAGLIYTANTVLPEIWQNGVTLPINPMTSQGWIYSIFIK